MPVVSIKGHEDYLRSSITTTLSWDLDGNLFLTPDNFWPSQFLLDFGEDGEPAGWNLRAGLPEKIVGYHVNASRPGSPKKDSVTRQTTAYTRSEEPAWKADGPIVQGIRSVGKDKRKPPAPVVELAPVEQRGYEAGRYGWAYFYESTDGDTTTTGYRYFDMLNNQIPKLTVPQSFPVGCVRWGVVLTQKNRGPASAAIQRRIPVDQLHGITEYDLKGPWRNEGPAPSSNTSGLGSPLAPVLGRDHKLVPSRLDMRAGTWRPYIHTRNDRGFSLLSYFGGAIRVKGTQERRVKEPDAGAVAFQGFQADVANEDHLRPSGKLSGDYLGQENDPEEGRLIGLLNERRRALNLPNLIVSQVMNREAYGLVTGSGEAEMRVSTLIDDASHALGSLDHPNLVDARYAAVGVARERQENGSYLWVVSVSEPIVDASYDAPTGLVCESVGPDGTVTTHAPDDVRADVSLNFNLVKTSADGSKSSDFSYSGSYASAVETAARRADDLGVVSILYRQNGVGVQNVITDGSLETGVMARTYSDGKTVLNSYYFAKATQNARNACVIHELFHALGFAHVTTPSVLNTPIRIDETTNHESPTTYDVSEYRRVYGNQTAPQPAPSPSPSPSKPVVQSNPGAPGQPGTSTPAPKPKPPTTTQTPPATRPPEPAPQDPADNTVQASRQNPYPGMISADKRPTIGVLLKRASGGITKAQIRLFFDKREVPQTGFSFVNGFLSYLPPAVLTGGSHSVAISVAGVEASEISWDFEVEETIEYEYVAGDYKRGFGISCRTPQIARRADVDFTYFFEHEAPDGSVKTYRVYDVRQGKDAYFRGDPGFEGFTIHGYPEDQTPAGVRYRLVEQEFPKEDTSVLEAPDPTSIPDAPVVFGTETPPAGPYLASIHGVTESGVLTQESETSPITLPPVSQGSTLSAFTFRVSPQKTVNLLRHAEFSQIGAGGIPESWTPAGIGGNNLTTLSVDKGVLTLHNTASTAVTASLSSTPISVPQGVPFTASGRIAVTRWVSGRASVYLHEYRANAQGGLGTFIQTTALDTLEGLGDAYFTKRFGPGGKAYHAETAFLVYVVALDANPSNLTTQVRDLAALPFASDLRKVDFASPGSKASDTHDALPATPHGAESFVAYAPPPTPPGAIQPVAVPPISVMDFSSGAVAPGWTQFGNSFVEAAPGGGFRMRVTDPVLSSGVGGGASYAFSPGRDDVALRTLLTLPAPFAHGYVRFMSMNAFDGIVLAGLKVYPEGYLTLLAFNARTGGYVEHHFANLYGGEAVDVEMIVSNATTDNARVDVWMGKNGAQRTLAFSLGSLPWYRAVARAFAGITDQSDARTTLDLFYRGVVLTEQGDVPNRENPAPPVNRPVAPPDRPRRALEARTAKTAYVAGAERVPSAFGTPDYNGHAYRADNAGTSGPNPPAFPLVVGTTVRDNAGLAAVTRSTAYALGASVLKPGGASPDAEWYEVVTVTGAGSTAAVAPAYPTVEGQTVVDGDLTLAVRKTLVWKEVGPSYREFEPDGNRMGQSYVFVKPGDGPLTMPILKRPIAVKPGMEYPAGIFCRFSVFGEPAPGVKVWLEGDGVEPILAATVGPFAGERGWHGTGDEDDSASYVVPKGYSRARYEATLTDGVYVFQEPLHAQGALVGFRARDSKRGYGRASAGEIAAILPSYPDGHEIGLDVGAYWTDLGVALASDIDASVDPSDGVEVYFSTSLDGVRFSEETTERDYLAPDAYLRIRVVLTGDGRKGPVIPSGGIHLRTFSPLAVLLRKDGSHFPGGVYADERIYATTYPDTEANRIGGHHQSVELTEDVTRLYDLVFGAATEAAMQEVDKLSMSDELILELPKAGGRVGGVAYLIRPREQTRFKPEGSIYVQGGHRAMRGVAKVGEAEVLEAASLRDPGSVAP